MRILPAFLLMSAPALAVTPFDSGNACIYGGKFVMDREVDSPWSIRILDRPSGRARILPTHYLGNIASQLSTTVICCTSPAARIVRKRWPSLLGA